MTEIRVDEGDSVDRAGNPPIDAPVHRDEIGKSPYSQLSQPFRHRRADRA